MRRFPLAVLLTVAAAALAGCGDDPPIDRGAQAQLASAESSAGGKRVGGATTGEEARAR